jgi:hypothetical protein
MIRFQAVISEFAGKSAWRGGFSIAASRKKAPPAAEPDLQQRLPFY